MPADIDGYSTVANDVIEYGDNYNTRYVSTVWWHQ